MRKILLIGEFNSITHNIYRSLMKRFYVQFCPGDLGLAVEVNRLVLGELTLISAVGMNEEQKHMILGLRKQFPNMPILCVGSQEELAMFGDMEPDERTAVLVRPVTIREIVENIYGLLGIQVGASSHIEVEEKKKKRILLIDDSPIQLRAMRGLLQKDYDIDMATSAAEAMKVIARAVPDMIFLDYDMPQCDGKMTFEMLKNDPVCGDVPVVFLTGVSEKGKVLSVLNMYPADYLLKPVDIDKLTGTIHNVLGE